MSTVVATGVNRGLGLDLRGSTRRMDGKFTPRCPIRKNSEELKKLATEEFEGVWCPRWIFQMTNPCKTWPMCSMASR
jgi:hypothetical protein